MSQDEAGRIARATERLRRTRGGVMKVALPTAAALGAGAAVALGSIPGGDGTITGCYVTAPAAGPYGALRVIDPQAPAGVPADHSSCQSGEATLKWNQSGPQGPPGPPGPPGSPGAAGGQGPAGTPLIGETSFGVRSSGGVFLKLPAVQGEATDKHHPGEIDLSSFSLGVGGSQGGGASGQGAGKVNVQSFVITKHLDKASPKLFQAAIGGTHYKEAVVTFAHKVKGTQRDYLKFKFATVFVSRIASGINGGTKSTEQVTFTFQKATETFINSNGKAVGSVGFQVGNKI